MVLMILSHTQLMVSIHLMTFLKVASSLCNPPGSRATSQRGRVPSEMAPRSLSSTDRPNCHRLLYGLRSSSDCFMFFFSGFFCFFLTVELLFWIKTEHPSKVSAERKVALISAVSFLSLFFFFLAVYAGSPDNTHLRKVTPCTTKTSPSRQNEGFYPTSAAV